MDALVTTTTVMATVVRLFLHLAPVSLTGGEMDSAGEMPDELDSGAIPLAGET
jgi:hypothetical protein